MKTTFIKLCSATLENKITHTNFTTFYCYLGYYDKAKSIWEDKMVEIDGQFRAKTMRVKMSDNLKQELLKDNNFPYVLELADEQDNYDYYVTTDKDKDKKIRLDKNGKSHKVLVLLNYQTKTHINPPRQSLDDME